MLLHVDGLGGFLRALQADVQDIGLFVVIDPHLGRRELANLLGQGQAPCDGLLFLWFHRRHRIPSLDSSRAHYTWMQGCGPFPAVSSRMSALPLLRVFFGFVTETLPSRW